MNARATVIKAAVAALTVAAGIAGAGAQSAVQMPGSTRAQPPAASSPEQTGTVIVQVNPPASVYLDGKLVTATAREHRTEVAQGPHRVRIVHPDYQDFVRVVDVQAGKEKTLAVALADKGVRKPPPARGRGAATARGAAGGRGSATPATLDPELASGIEFVKQGDFQPAVDVLFAVVKNLAGVPGRIGQWAQAYLYLGVALLELDQPEEAKIAFALARGADKTLTPRATEFSRQILGVWDESRSVPTDAELKDPTLYLYPPPVETGTGKNEKPVEVEPGDAEFIAEAETGVSFDLAVPTNGHPCSGRLTIDRDQRTVAWAPASDGCAVAFEVPFDDLRSPAAAPRGGLLLQFKSARPSLTVMPAPDADLLEPDVEKMTVTDLPAATRVHMRRAERRIFDALGRPYDPRMNGLVVYVPIADLVENPSDYDGGIIRTSGKLTAPSPTKGPYTLTDENASVQIVASGAAIQLLRSRAAEWINKELIVSGTFSRPKIVANAPKTPVRPAFAISATKIEPAEGLKYKGNARSVTIEELVKSPPRGRELIRVIGKYRGTNSFGDLPIDSRRDGNDWVIKDQGFAVWVTGRPPSGSGFSLDASSQIDRESSWVAVTGTVDERKGFPYVRAEKIELSPPPSESASVTAVRLQTGARNLRPDVIYTDPVQENEELALDQQLLLQFTKAMDDASFASHVQLRYADGAPARFPYLSVRYYADRNRSVIIDPGSALQRGKTLECVLLPGIKDIDGQPLVGTEAPGGRVFKWKVRSGR
jgi:Big-like domain-containing protein/PEGA domain-containing protein